MEEARNFVVSEKEENIAALSGDVIMQSVGIPKEELKLNKPVPAPHLNSCKFHTSLEEACNLDAVIIVGSDNSSSECNNQMVIETEDYDYGSVKPSSPSVM